MKRMKLARKFDIDFNACGAIIQKHSSTNDTNYEVSQSIVTTYLLNRKILRKTESNLSIQ